MIPEPETNIHDDPTAGPVDVLILVPFVDGMLREQTMAAVHESGLPYLTQPLDPADPYHYAATLRDWWKLPMDIVIIEQDMVPTTGQISELIYNDHRWVAMPYHVGHGQYTTGLGFCKISAALRQTWPDAGVNASTDPRDSRNLIGWPSLNENVDRHLFRLGERQTVIGTPVAHLHYPEPDRA